MIKMMEAQIKMMEKFNEIDLWQFFFPFGWAEKAGRDIHFFPFVVDLAFVWKQLFHLTNALLSIKPRKYLVNLFYSFLLQKPPS